MAVDRRLDVQGLRALAIFSVILFHFYPQYFPNGFLGVDVFFIISGYLIFIIFSRSIKKFGLNCGSISNFYYRRLARIVPLSLFYICLAVIAYTYMAATTIISKSQTSAWRALLFLTNIYAVIEKDDYFDRLLDENLFTHTWSLAVEVQYYLLVPLLFLINDKMCGNSAFFHPLIAVGSFLMYILSPPQFSFNMMPTRLWQFLFISCFSERLLKPEEETLEEGEVLLASSEEETEENLQNRIVPKEPLYVPFIYYTSFILLSLPFFPFPLHDNITRIVVSISTAYVIAYGNNIEAIQNPVLTNPLSVFIGDISYSLYLFHWPFSVYLNSSFSSIDINWGIPLSLVTTIVIYHIFEKRYRKWTKNVVLISSLLLFLISAFLIIYSPQLNQAIQKKTTAEKEAVIKENEYTFAHPDQSVYFSLTKCNYTKWRNVPFAPPDRPYGLCNMPRGEGKLKFMLIGNSYAPNQGALVYEAFKPFFSEFTIFSMSGCEVLSYSRNSMCTHPIEFQDVIADFKPDVMFIIQRYFVPTEPLPSPGEADKIYQEMKYRLDLISNMSSLIFLEDSFPSTEVHQMRRLNAMIRDGKDAAYINSVCLNHKVDDFARTRTKQLMQHCGDKCHLFDLKPALADRSGQVMAVDEDTWMAIFEIWSHLTLYGQEKVAPIFRQLARQYGGQLRRLEKTLYSSSL